MHVKVKVGLKSGCGELEHISAIFYCEVTQAWLYFGFGENDGFESRPVPDFKTFLILDLPQSTFDPFLSWLKQSKYADQEQYNGCSDNCVSALCEALVQCGVQDARPALSCHVYSCFCCFFPVPMMTPKAFFRLLQQQGACVDEDLPALRSECGNRYARSTETPTSALLRFRY